MVGEVLWVGELMAVWKEVFREVFGPGIPSKFLVEAVVAGPFEGALFVPLSDLLSFEAAQRHPERTELYLQ